MSAITAKARRKMKKYAVLTREPRCFLGSFDFSWEQRKLSDLTSMHARIGWQNLRTSEFLDSGNYMLITGTDFNDGAINFSTCHYVERERYEQDRNIQIHNGSILITKDGTLGKVAYVQGLSMPATLNAGVFNVQIKDANNVDEKYLFQYLKAPFLMDYVDKKATGGTIKHLNQSILVDFPVILPQRSEQTLIGAFFQQLDNLITLHQRKCVFLFSFFRACISMNFTASTFSWEQRKVGDLLIERNQQAPMSDEYPLMAFIANEGVAPKGERYDRSALVTDTVNKLYKKTEKGDFIYSSNNLETGSIGLNKYGKACISPVYSIFEPTGIADSDFLGRRLVRKDFINAMVKWRQGVIYGQWRIHESDFLKIEITVPSVEEQRKIGTYLDQLDHLITLHQRECISFTGSAGRLILTANKKRTASSWEQRKLGDISEIKTGPFGSTLHADDYVSDGTPIITTEHFKTGALPRSKNGLPQVSDSDYKRLTAYTLDDGDIVFSRVGSVDINALITPFQSNWLFSGRVLRVRPQTDISSKFLHTRLETESIKTDIRTRAVGQTMPSINTEILKITPLVLPSSAAEQEQIGSYFAALDNLITLHQRKPFLMKWRNSDANRNQTNRLVL